MPEMDGYEATQRIRSNIRASYNKIPIVALTANAMVGEKEKCIQIGMNDFLSKPIEDQKLHEVLAKYLEKSNSDVSVEDKVSDLPEVKTSLKSVDIGVLEKLNALQEDGEPDIVVDLIGSFTTQTPARLTNLAAALATADYETVCDEAHTIKSSARTMGGMHLGELCQQLEDLRENPAVDKIQSLSSQIQNEYLKMASELEEIVVLRQQKTKVA
jgi:HPt (histidine-containing phosphotransfer) domain-containing protein